MQPLNFLCALGVVGFLARFKWPVVGQRIMNISLLLIVIIGFFPIGKWMFVYLERQFPKPTAGDMPQNVDGIVVLGGAFLPAMTKTTGNITANDNIDRMFCFVKLARQYPNAKLVFSGGSGDILNPTARESDDAKAFFALSGLEGRNIVYEENSKNTYENVVFTNEIMNPKPEEEWIVVTSAYHMPRTIGIFQKIGWDITPYQCDQRTDGTYRLFTDLPNLAGNYGQINNALKEIIGSFVYYITGKSSSAF